MGVDVLYEVARWLVCIMFYDNASLCDRCLLLGSLDMTAILLLVKPERLHLCAELPAV